MLVTSFILILAFPKGIVCQNVEHLALDTIDYVFETFFSDLDSEKCGVVNDLGFSIPSQHLTISIKSENLDMIHGMKMFSKNVQELQRIAITLLKCNE